MTFYISPAQNWDHVDTRVELHELKPGYRIRAWSHGIQYFAVVTEKLRGGQWHVDLMMIGHSDRFDHIWDPRIIGFMSSLEGLEWHMPFKHFPKDIEDRYAEYLGSHND